MSNSNGSQLAFIVIAALFGVPPGELDIIHISIIFASLVGAGWSLKRYKPKTFFDGFMYFVRIALTAAVLTSAAAKIIVGFFPSHVPVEGLMTIIAFFIGLIGDDWQKAYYWIIGFLKKKVKDGEHDHR